MKLEVIIQWKWKWKIKVISISEETPPIRNYYRWKSAGIFKPFGYLDNNCCNIQGVSRLDDFTTGGDFLGLCDQKYFI